MVTPLEILDLGIRSYQEVWELQKNLVQQRIEQKIPDTLIFVEHLPVVTRGRRTLDGEILKSLFPIFEVERGGKATYHGPGQLVGYPIIDLSTLHQGVKKYIESLEEILIKGLNNYSIYSYRKEGATGVWVGNKKIASIGIAVKRWVTYHGFALNVNTDLTAFETIHPCGFESSVMTSMKEIQGKEFLMADVKKELSRVAQTFLKRWL